jgi:hypothetical protein
MRRGRHHRLASALAGLVLAACAAPEATRRPEGHVVLQAGAAPSGATSAPIVSGPPLRRLAILVPAFEPAREAVWPEGGAKNTGGGGATAGFLTGIAVVQAAPVILLYWPAAVGVLAGTTALGALGQQMEGTVLPGMESQDRATLIQAAANLHPDRILRQAMIEALAGRAGQSPLSIPWHPTWGPDTPGTDPAADARRQGADGLLELAVEAVGLAAGEEPETFGVFVRVRAQVLEASEGGLRYGRVLEHGPGRPLAELPRPATYTVEFLAADRARVFRHEAQETIVRMARLLARDPAFPVAMR